MCKYKPYPAYKDSGVEWLGEVPDSWIPAPLKHHLTTSPCYGVLKPDKYDGDNSVPIIRILDVGDDVVATEKLEHISPSLSAEYSRTLIKEGDLVVSVVGSIGRVFICRPEHEGANLSRALARVVPRSSLSARFLRYAINSSCFKEFVELTCVGAAQKVLNMDALANWGIVVPSQIEQAQIAAFLDHETAKIDRLIEKQEKLIELLKEKRQAVISHAVTKGLDPNVPMKDSGVEWLGEIPAHWVVKPLTHLVDDRRPIMYGIVLPGPNVEDGVPIVKGGDVKPGRLRLKLLCKTTHEIEAGYERSRLRHNDIVYSIRGSIGDAELVPKEIEGANLTQDAARIAPAEGVCVNWLVHAVACKPVFEQLSSKSMGAAVKGINIRDLKKALIPFPPLQEQENISQYIHDSLQEMDALKALAEKAIRLMQERRTALISAAVTGKIDVREQPNDS